MVTPGAARSASVKAFRQVIAIDEQLIREEPINVLYRRDAAVYNRAVALVLIRTKDLPEAQIAGDRSAELFEELAKEDQANAEAQEAPADSYYSQGYLRMLANDSQGALKHYDAAIAAYDSLAAKHPGRVANGLRTVYQLMAELGIKTKDTVRTLNCAKRDGDRRPASGRQCR